MENKYYTPKIEEFHVGFEYEFSRLGIWEKNIYDVMNFACNIEDVIDKIRVKYLDQQDIEAEGWETCGEVEWKFGHWQLTEYKNNEVLIENCQDFMIPMYAVFKVKNRSELHRIMQQLGIK